MNTSSRAFKIWGGTALQLASGRIAIITFSSTSTQKPSLLTIRYHGKRTLFRKGRGIYIVLQRSVLTQTVKSSWGFPSLLGDFHLKLTVSQKWYHSFFSQVTGGDLLFYILFQAVESTVLNGLLFIFQDLLGINETTAKRFAWFLEPHEQWVFTFYEVTRLES